MPLKTIVDKIENKQSVKRAKGRKTSVKEGAFYGVSEGFGLSYITAFALDLGANNVHIGLLKSLPELLGNFSQLFAIKALVNKNRRQIVFLGILIQSILWLAIMCLALAYLLLKKDLSLGPVYLIILYTFLLISGHSINPIWSSWMNDLLPFVNKGDFFGRRNRIIGIVVILTMLIAGFFLDFFKQTNVFIAYIFLFGFSFIARFISALLIRKQYEPRFSASKENYFSLFMFIKKCPKYNFGRFILFYAFIIFAINIASPFYSVYLLKDLNFNYLWYTFYLIVSVGSYYIFMPFWGRLGDKHGNIEIIKFVSRLLPLIPFFWFLTIFFKQFGNLFLLIYILIITFLGDLLYAGLILSSTNFVYEAVSRDKLAIIVTYKNIFAVLGLFFGSLLGGIISNINFSFWILGPLLFTFLISFIFRSVAYFYWVPKLRDVRKEVSEFKLTEEMKEIKLFIPNILSQINFKIKR